MHSAIIEKDCIFWDDILFVDGTIRSKDSIISQNWGRWKWNTLNRTAEWGTLKQNLSCSWWKWFWGGVSIVLKETARKTAIKW
jgi:hypothetical protein